MYYFVFLFLVCFFHAQSIHSMELLFRWMGNFKQGQEAEKEMPYCHENQEGFVAVRMLTYAQAVKKGLPIDKNGNIEKQELSNFQPFVFSFKERKKRHKTPEKSEPVVFENNDKQVHLKGKYKGAKAFKNDRHYLALIKRNPSDQ